MAAAFASRVKVACSSSGPVRLHHRPNILFFICGLHSVSLLVGRGILGRAVGRLVLPALNKRNIVDC